MLSTRWININTILNVINNSSVRARIRFNVVGKLVVVVSSQLTISLNTILPTSFRWVKSAAARLYVTAFASPMLFKYFVDAALRSMKSIPLERATWMVASRCGARSSTIRPEELYFRRLRGVTRIYPTSQNPVNG